MIEKKYIIHPVEKYLAYKNANGFNNQRQSLENAILIAKEIKRTLIIPEVILRNDSNFNDAYQGPFAPWSMFLDIEDIQKIVKIVDIHNPSILDLPKKYVNSIKGAEKHLWIDRLPTPGSLEDIYFQRQCQNWSVITTVRGLLEEFENDPTPILFFENLQGSDLFTYLSSEKYIFHRLLIDKSVHYNKNIVDKAQIVIKSLNQYASLHLRRTDFFYILEPDIVAKCLEKILYPGQKLFLATDEKQQKILQPLYQKFNVFSLNDFQTEIGQVANNEMIGCIEQSICTHSQIFIGTEKSTFTNFIKRMRFTNPNLPNRQVYLLSKESNFIKLRESKFNNYLRF